MKRLRYAMGCAVLALAACGGSGGEPPSPLPPGDTALLTASITPAGQLSLPADATITVQFSAAVNQGSLELGGSFLALAPAARWSAPDILQLEPPASGWPRGRGGDLTVQAAGATGAVMAGPATARFLVPLQLVSGQAALGAIGQADLASNNAQAANGRSERTLFSPVGNIAVAPDGRIFVGDNVNHRILAFAAVPSGSDAGASLVFGQPDFTSATAGLAQGAFTRPQNVSIGAGRLAAVDYSNQRVLVWNTVPSTSGTLPDMVIGQPDFGTTGSACSATGLNFVEAAFLTADNKLIIADTENHRVLIWLAVPASAGVPPDLVLGQSGPARCTANDDDQNGVRDATPSNRTLRRPTGIWSDGQRLVVVDSTNHRVLVWSTFPTANFQPASVVLGQGDFTRAVGNDDNQDGAADATPTARTLRDPWAGVHSNGVQLAVADSGNNRVLVWNTFPVSSFQPADAVLGQADFSNSASATAPGRMNYPTGAVFHGDKLLVTDRFNNRVLVIQSP